MSPEAKGQVLGVLISGETIIVKAYSPEPLIPCKVLNAISWLSDCAKPLPMEKAMKTTNAPRTVVFRPVKSLS